MIGRLIRWTIGALVISSIGAAIAALVVKQRMPSVGTAESDEVALVTIFGPLEFTSTATAFRGGSLVCWYGGGDIDLRGATLDPAGARLTIKVLFGGGRVLVPDEWDVQFQVTPIAGGVGDAREARERPADAPRLIIDGFAAFGGFGVDSIRREKQVDVPELTDIETAPTNGVEEELVPALEV